MTFFKLYQKSNGLNAKVNRTKNEGRSHFMTSARCSNQIMKSYMTLYSDDFWKFFAQYV